MEHQARGVLTTGRCMFEVIDPTYFESNWIPKGEDVQIEQQLLARMKKCL